jgi:uncharacterized membrane protein
MRPATPLPLKKGADVAADYLLLLAMPVLVCLGQILLKKNSGSIVTDEGAVRFLISLANPGIITGAAAVAGAPLLYIGALEAVPLSRAFAFNSLTYTLVFISSRFFLKEDAGFLNAAGTVLITAGFLLPFIAGVIFD